MISQVSGTEFQVSSSHNLFPVDFIETSESKAKQKALQQDWEKITRNHLIAKGSGIWETENGRIQVVRKNAKDLTALLPNGHRSTKPGYAVFLDGNYKDCSFDLRDAQFKIGFVPPTTKGQRQAEVYNV